MAKWKLASAVYCTYMYAQFYLLFSFALGT